MTLIKKSDVKNHLSTRQGGAVLPFKSPRNPGGIPSPGERSAEETTASRTERSVSIPQAEVSRESQRSEAAAMFKRPTP